MVWTYAGVPLPWAEYGGYVAGLNTSAMLLSASAVARSLALREIPRTAYRARSSRSRTVMSSTMRSHEGKASGGAGGCTTRVKAATC